MHLQQTKRASAASGGPQYYFHSLSNAVKTFLRAQGAVPVALVTPYGATKSHFIAVSEASKLDHAQKPIPGNVGHDRIQQGEATESIGEAIRYWYRLPAGQFERIDVEIDIIDDAFYVRPSQCIYAGKPRPVTIARVERPLTFSCDYMSPFWRKQLAKIQRESPELLEWSVREICRVAKDHRPDSKLRHIQEPDILRASGPLHHLGVILGGYVGKGYDCATVFEFMNYPRYFAPLELKRNSVGFQYQQRKYGKDELSRAVILCANHNHSALPINIDVIELEAFYRFGRDILSIEL